MEKKTNGAEAATAALERYNRPVPRYTSYPPANFFGEFGEREYLEAVEASNDARERNLSFYFHVPFCPRLCHYCACNSYPMRSASEVDAYVEALHREIDLLLPHLAPDRRVAQIHFGGGTPSALPADALKRLVDRLLGRFGTIDRPEIAIECHPGTLTLPRWKELLDAGFTRTSVGVQDFDEAVLKTVNRAPSAEPLERVFELLRSRGVGVNLDFIYGLPGQTARSFGETIRRAAGLRPDRLVTFGYAHVPWLKKSQLLLEKAGLPETAEKRAMFDRASEILAEAGYLRVGLDHFVLPGDELHEALRNGRLHRNFQGYCTRRTTAQVYAFGVTGISQLETAYAQNARDVDEYVREVGEGRLPVRRGYALSPRERLTREAIETLMCNGAIDWAELAARLGTDAASLKAATAYDPAEIARMAADGLIRADESGLRVSEGAAPFVRYVAASLDPLMKDCPKRFSRPV